MFLFFHKSGNLIQCDLLIVKTDSITLLLEIAGNVQPNWLIYIPDTPHYTGLWAGVNMSLGRREIISLANIFISCCQTSEKL